MLFEKDVVLLLCCKFCCIEHMNHTQNFNVNPKLWIYMYKCRKSVIARKMCTTHSVCVCVAMTVTMCSFLYSYSSLFVRCLSSWQFIMSGYSVCYAFEMRSHNSNKWNKHTRLRWKSYVNVCLYFASTMCGF